MGCPMRSKSYALVCLAFFLFASSRANAQEFAAAIGQVAIGRCHMDDCSFFVIEDSKPVGSTKEGTLFAIAAKSWESECRGRGGKDERERDTAAIKAGRHGPFVTFVFCSKTNPIEFFYRDSKWLADTLRPGDAEAMSGAEEYAYVFLCRLSSPIGLAIASRGIRRPTTRQGNLGPICNLWTYSVRWCVA
jgi:hypothetical protein